ncbi:hypothetical protein GE061_004427 [Apolygus lucorum]|uniref:MOG interacting and ectopic P-granules protein 1 n=1 Tax=Apolygus lucorum TaxID=248454 RepID=A0A8S9X140_APOLU|nr:hypothetical protein GE061_004427 [Apolygus lucorum]
MKSEETEEAPADLKQRVVFKKPEKSSKSEVVSVGQTEDGKRRRGRLRSYLPHDMDSVDENSDMEAPSKIINDQVHKDDVKVNGEVNGACEDGSVRGEEDEAVDDRSMSPMSEDNHANGDVDDESHENGVDGMDVDENNDDAGEVDDTVEEGGDDDVAGEDEEVEGGDVGVEGEDEIEGEHEVEEEDIGAADGANNDLGEPMEEDEQEEQGVETGSAEEQGEDECSDSDRKDENSDSVPRNSREDKKSDSSDKEKDSSETSAKEQDDESEEESLSVSKSLISNIRGVDASTPMSKELEDLSKIGARGSLEITLVKKDASGDSKSKEDEIDRASEPAILTITDASSKNSDSDKTPKKKSDDDDDSVIEVTPDKGSAKKKKSQPINVTPRRSSRNLNKSKSYTDKDPFIEEVGNKKDDEDDDVQEVVPTDPLAMTEEKAKIKKTTIVVNDTKKLVEIAAGSKQNRVAGKKEPTLVIIDTNSILSGKGGIPISASLPQMSITPAGRATTTQQAFMRSLNSPAAFVSKPQVVPIPQPQPAPAQPKPIILPSLTDDMFVVEAPSFIVPYVYEKPPVTPLKEYVTDMEKLIREREKEERDKKKERKEKRKEEKEKEAAKAEEKKTEAEKGEADKADTDKVEADGDDKEEADKPEDGISGDKKTEDIEGEDKEKSDDAKPKDEVEEKAEGDATKKKEDEAPKKVEDAEYKDDRSDTDSDDDDKASETSAKDSDGVEIVGDTRKKSENYFENPLGKFFMQIGVNLVQEHVQTDLLRNQKRKRDKDEKNCPPEVHKAINSLLKTLEYSKENNKPYKMELEKCKLCNFKTESELVMAHHLETPHMRNYVYRCNFCTLEVRSPHDILLHMESAHNVRGRLERAPAFHQCPNCPFEDGQKGKLSRHLLSCAKKYKPERNQEPPLDWEPPAKIPRVKGARPGIPGGPLYNTATLVPRGGVPLGRMPTPAGHSLLAPRGRGRPPIYINRGGVTLDGRQTHPKSLAQLRPGMVFRPAGTNSQPQVLIPTAYNSLYQKGNNPAVLAAASAGATAKLLQQPSISITPLPRQSSSPAQSGGQATAQATPPQNMPYVAKPGRPAGGSKTTFVICEICDGYIKDLEQLRNHMQWIHKVKIHPKMIYNRPPLNCQKCQFRFFTDQGLERHLLGSHGLVTSSMQEAANKGKDGGRCPVCGRVYQWKLLNHVARDHNMSLKPAHLSYKCTVCTATFGMYKQFESHVYSAHSVVAKRVMDKKNPGQPAQQPSTSSTSQSDSLLKPLKINDEITIIPTPARAKTKTPQQPTPPAKPAKV